MYRSLSIAYIEHSARSMEHADFKIKINFHDIDSFSDQDNRYIYEYGKKVAEAMIPDLKKQIAKMSAQKQKNIS